METPVEYKTSVKEKQRKIFNHYGLDHQLEKLEEECLELALGILHRDKPGNENFRNIVEEMADVKNLIEQIELKNPYFRQGIEKWIDYKTDRELERIRKRVKGSRNGRIYRRDAAIGGSYGKERKD